MFPYAGTHHPILCNTTRTRLRYDLTESVETTESREHMKTCKDMFSRSVDSLSTGLLSPEPVGRLRGSPPPTWNGTSLPHPGVQAHNSPDTYRDALLAMGQASSHHQAGQCGSPPPLLIQDKHLASSSIAKGSIVHFCQSKEAACPERISSRERDWWKFVNDCCADF